MKFRYLVPVLLGLSLARPALAVDVEPLRLELSIPLDEPTQAELTISNTGPRPVTVKLSTGPYRSFQPGLPIPSAQDWVTLDPAEFSLAPGASSVSAVIARPPAALLNDAAGEYLAAILVDELPAAEEPSPAGASRVTVVPRIALPVYLTVKGRERVEVEISGLSAEVSQSLTAATSGRSAELLRVNTTLRNNGTVHTRPKGTLALFNAEGQIVRAVGLGKTLPLLPAATLLIPTTLPLPHAGRYKAVATVEGAGGQLLQREHRFEVTPDSRLLSGKELRDD